MYEAVSFTTVDDKLRRVSWRFWLYQNCLVLDEYLVEERASAKHKFKTVKVYDRRPVGRRSYLAAPFDARLKEEEVPLTDEVRARALREMVNQIKVVLWSEVPR